MRGNFLLKKEVLRFYKLTFSYVVSLKALSFQMRYSIQLGIGLAKPTGWRVVISASKKSPL